MKTKLSNRLPLIAIALLLFITFTGCLKNGQDSRCLSSILANTSSISGPASVPRNETGEINVSFQALNGCGQFERFIESTVADTSFIQIIARYDGCVCTQDLPIRTAKYSFKKTLPGTYYFKFVDSTAFRTQQVTVF